MVDPVGGKGSGETQWGLGNKASIPPGIPLPADDPWVKALALLLETSHCRSSALCQAI